MRHSRRGIGGNGRSVSVAVKPGADLLGRLIAPSRQEVFFSGTPAGDLRFSEGMMPVWVDFGSRVFYGFPGTVGTSSRATAKVLA
jgi:hypothetical protein